VKKERRKFSAKTAKDVNHLAAFHRLLSHNFNAVKNYIRRNISNVDIDVDLTVLGMRKLFSAYILLLFL
jgi:hypothetical protein